MNKEKLRIACDQVNKHWHYRSDPDGTFDTWKFPDLINGRYSDDCDGYGLAVLEKLYGRKGAVLKILNPLSEVRVYYVKTREDVGHFVTNIGEYWFDNWTRRPMTKREFFKETGHKIKMRYYFPITSIFLVQGAYGDVASLLYAASMAALTAYGFSSLVFSFL